ncbi:N-acetyltransferase DgcN [Salinimonas chungwhensis]|uniref:N-acetyltransferase DgcN n=1 Tax=Salinimonas chungwhensis TaxID=265425 RepID=UPI0003644CEE
MIQSPYLLFIGDATDPLSIKMARSVADWRAEKCLGEYALPGCEVTTGCPALDIDQAAERGAKSFILGFANSGGHLDERYLEHILKAIDAGMDIVSGLHDKLSNYPELVKQAQDADVRLVDIRHPSLKLKTGTGKKRSGKRLLTVGTDCSVGKMYTSLSLTRALQQNDISATFRATGQSGILVAGEGIPIDCVIADFISGAAEVLSPDNTPEHWDIIEGQGSLSHPAFAGVSLGLLHGSQPDALVICHALKRSHMRGLPHVPQPSIEETINLNVSAARLTNPAAQVIGIAVNTSAVTDAEATAWCQQTSAQFNLPCVDPVRHGVDELVRQL